MNRLKNLEDIRIFMKVIECGSFTTAANRLDLSPTTVSKQIARLEKILGIHLFERNTRSIRLTQEGHVLAVKFQTALKMLDDATDCVQESHGQLSGVIKITAPIPIGRRYLAAITAKFRKRYPEIGFSLHLTDHIVDLYTCDMDLAIRVANLVDSNLVARKLADNHRILVAAPQYLKAYGYPLHPSDLYRHQCLLFSTQGMSRITWKLKNNDNEVIELAISSQMVADNGDVLRHWSELGLGIALRETWDVSSLLQEGKLIHVLPEWTDEGIPIHIVRTIREPIPTRIKYFINFLIHEWDEDFSDLY